MKLLYGTTNQAKLELMRRAVEPIGIEIIGLSDLGREIPSVDESGNSPLENAELKARTYFEAFHMPVFSCDSGLYFEGLADEEQPGVHVRRIGGRELSDAAMTEYYAELSRKNGGNIIGQYRNAIFLILDEEHAYSSMDLSIATEPFILSDTPHPKRVAGFPLDCLSKDPKSGEFYYDMKEMRLVSGTEAGLRDFFKEVFEKQ